MRKLMAVVLGLAMVLFVVPTAARAAGSCPPELAQAKAALARSKASVKKTPQIAKGQDIQAPRSQAGAKPEELQAARSQELQAPRSQELQAPRGQQEVPVPRSQELQAPRVSQATALVQESEAACKKGDMALSARKAREALDLLK